MPTLPTSDEGGLCLSDPKRGIAIMMHRDTSTCLACLACLAILHARGGRRSSPRGTSERKWFGSSAVVGGRLTTLGDRGEVAGSSS